MKKVLHWPRLDTVLMVENTIKYYGMISSKKRLSEALKKKVMSQTLNLILQYLEESGKIEIKNRKIFWIVKARVVGEYEKALKSYEKLLREYEVALKEYKDGK